MTDNLHAGIDYNVLQKLTLPYVNDDCNLVVLAPTSSGKTIVAEQFMFPTLKGGGKTLYLSPLKALTNEKLLSWQKLPFSCAAFTGDHGKPGVVVPQQVILMTTECLDSKTRGAKAWLKKINILIADEAHMLSQFGRGDAFEIGLTRFALQNPSARLIFLSAMIPNAQDLGKWLTSLNGKQTEVVETDWRPVKQRHYYYSAPDRFWDFMNFSKRKCSAIINNSQGKQVLIFVQSVGVGKMISKALGCPFHYSKVSKKKRSILEQQFRDKELLCMVSTSTLAYGINLPADVGIIVGAHRGPQMVDAADVKQMAGRIGRYGLSEEGEVHYIFMRWYFEDMKWQLENIPPIKSVLTKRIYFHLVSLIAREKMGLQDIYSFMGRTFAGQTNDMRKEVDEALDLLKQYEIVSQHGDVLTTNAIGRAAALMYIDPLDLYVLKRNLIQKPLTPTTIAKAFAAIPSLEYDTYVPPDMGGAVQMKYGAQTLLATAISSWLSGDVLTDAVNVTLFSFTADLERQITALKIANVDKTYLDNIYLMLKNGVTQKYLELISLPGIGRTRAKTLFGIGIRTKKDFVTRKKAAKNAVGALVYAKAADTILNKGKVILRF